LARQQQSVSDALSILPVKSIAANRLAKLVERRGPEDSWVKENLPHMAKQSNLIKWASAQGKKIDKDLAKQDINTDPSEKQKESGTYKKGKVRLYGLDISIENPKGSYRQGVSPDGTEWKSKMHHHYGYIKGTVARDKDQIDIFLGSKPESDDVFVVNQVDPKTKKFDEHKVMLGFSSPEQAKKGYLANYDKGWKGFGSMKQCSVKEFKYWLKDGNTKKEFEPMSKSAAIPQSVLKEYADIDDRRNKLDEVKRLLDSYPEYFAVIPGASVTRTKDKGLFKDLRSMLEEYETSIGEDPSHDWSKDAGLRYKKESKEFVMKQEHKVASRSAAWIGALATSLYTGMYLKDRAERKRFEKRMEDALRSQGQDTDVFVPHHSPMVFNEKSASRNNMTKQTLIEFVQNR